MTERYWIDQGLSDLKGCAIASVYAFYLPGDVLPKN